MAMKMKAKKVGNDTVKLKVPVLKRTAQLAAGFWLWRTARRLGPLRKVGRAAAARIMMSGIAPRRVRAFVR